jgi:ABC-2 type transport system permease protein
MLAIFKREIKAYFLTPIGCLYMGLFLLITGIFFFFTNLSSQSSYYSSFLGNILFIYLFAVPLLTMRLFSEEKRQRTDQLLLTSPISIVEIVCGKFLAALCLYAMTLVVTVFYAVIIAIYGDLLVWETLGSYIGFLFLGASYISIGIFVSASTENQITAALVTFFSLFVIWLIDPIAQTVPSDYFAGAISAGILALIVVLFLFLSTRNWFIVLATAVVAAAVILFLYFWVEGYRYPFRGIFTGFLQKFLGWFSLNKRYQDFSMGLLKFDSLLYYVSFSGLFLFLTVRLIEKRRWN